MSRFGSDAALVVARLQDGWESLRSELFPTQVLLEISDQLLVAQRLPSGRQSLQEAVIVPVPAATCRNGQPLQIEALGDFIGDLLLNNGDMQAQVSVVLPAALTHWRVLQGPLLEASLDGQPITGLEALRQRNPPLGLPFGLEQAYLDLIPLEQQDDHQQDAQALVVAMERAQLDSWLQVLDIAGVKLDQLVPLQVAVMAALQPYITDPDPGVLVAVLLPEGKSIRLLVWQAGLPLYERQLPGDPEQLLAELQTCLHFLEGQQADRSSAEPTLLLAAGLSAEAEQTLIQRALEQLGVPLLQPELDGYGTLALQGLARLEEER